MVVDDKKGVERKGVNHLHEVLAANYLVKGVLKENICLKPGIPQLIKLWVKGVDDELNVRIVEGTEKIEDLTMVVTLNSVMKEEI